MSRRLLSLAAIAGSLLLAPRAQSTNITCLRAYDWMNNAQGQNPCTVATYAQEACGGDWSITPFPPPTYTYDYPGPDAASRSPCMCSTVTYSLFSACGVCQNGTIAPWTGWVSNCSTITPSIQTFPAPIPVNTSFPAWAYLPVLASNFFNVTAAHADVSAPASSPVPPSTFGSPPTSTPTPGNTTASTTTAFTSTTLSITSTSSSSTASITATSQKATSNAGAIAGGTVGGVAAVAIIAALVAFFLRRKRQSHAAGATMGDSAYGGDGGGAYDSPHTTSPPITVRDRSYAQPVSLFNDLTYAEGAYSTSRSQASNQAYRPYEAVDPSAYGNSTPSPAQTSTNSGTALYSLQPQRGQYTGVAEV